MKAFPNSKYNISDTNGMELRDYFAAYALIALGAFEDSPEGIKKYAQEAYTMADAMMEARKEKK